MVFRCRSESIDRTERRVPRCVPRDSGEVLLAQIPTARRNWPSPPPTARTPEAWRRSIRTPERWRSVRATRAARAGKRTDLKSAAVVGERESV